MDRAGALRTSAAVGYASAVPNTVDRLISLGFRHRASRPTGVISALLRKNVSGAEQIAIAEHPQALRPPL
jgi:hypothetical protein